MYSRVSHKDELNEPTDYYVRAMKSGYVDTNLKAPQRMKDLEQIGLDLPLILEL